MNHCVHGESGCTPRAAGAGGTAEEHAPGAGPLPHPPGSKGAHWGDMSFWKLEPRAPPVEVKMGTACQGRLEIGGVPL